MATTQNTFTGNGSTVLFSFTFPYLDSTDILVSVNGTLTTAYTLANATTIQFTTAPANGAAIRIFRVTDDATLAATFYPGSSIRSQDLNENFTQNLYATQESNRDATTAISTANGAVTTANTALSNSTAATSTANTASANASAAVSTANTANSNASAAVSTANTASSNASAAVSTANAAAVDAATAISTANGAVSTANAATSTANTALSNSTAAVSTANTASSNASAAVSTANTASSNASTAVSTANSALSTANTALSNSSTAISTANSASAAVASAVIYQPVVDLTALGLLTPADGDFFELQDSTGADTDPDITGVPGGLVGAPGLTFRLRYDDPPQEFVFLGYFANDSETRYLKFSGGTMTGALVVPLASAATPSLTFTGDLNTGIFSPGANQLAVATNGAGRLYIASDGKVGIGTSAPGKLLEVSSSTDATIRINDPATVGTVDRYIGGVEYYTNDSSGGAKVACSIKGYHVDLSGKGRLQFATGNETTAMTINGSQQVGFGTTSPGAALEINAAAATSPFIAKINTSEAARIDSSGRLLVGTSSASQSFDGGTTIGAQIEHTGSSNKNLLRLVSNAVANWSSVLSFARSRGATNGAVTAVASDDNLGSLSWAGADGTGHVLAAQILASVDGTPGANSMPGRIVLSTTAAGASTPTERMRITSAGRVGIGTTSPGVNLQVQDDSSFSLIRVVASSGNVAGIDFGDAADTDTAGVRYDNVSDSMAFRVNASERARIDSSGRLLIGTSSAVAVHGITAGLELHALATTNGASASIARFAADAAGPQLNLGKSRSGTLSPGGIVQNNDTLGEISFCGDDGTDITSRAARIACEVDGTPGANDMPGRLIFSTTADGNSSPTERMRITSAGNVGIGITSPTSRLFVNGSSAASNLIVNAATTAFSVYNDEVTGEVRLGAIDTSATNAKFLSFYTNPSGSSTGTERVRIDSSGRLLVGTSTNGGAGGLTIRPNFSAGAASLVFDRANTASTSTVVSFENNDSTVGTITHTNTATAYNTSSDYRLKENVVPLDGAIARLNQIPVHRFNFIADPDTVVDGFIAHEAQEVVPECVTGTKDEVDDDGNPVMQGIDQSKLVPLLTAALQEAIAKIETLEARLTAAGI
jgi:hypothetical protein